MEKKRIVTNEELQIGLSSRLLELEDESPNLNLARAYFSGVGKLLASVRRDMDAAQHLGVPYTERTKRFLGIE